MNYGSELIKDGISSFVLMRLYLFGKYEGLLNLDAECASALTYPEKNIEKAIELIPSYLASFYSSDEQERKEMEFLFLAWMRQKGYDLVKYVPDYDLKEFALNMEGEYPTEDIERFVARFLKEVASYESVMESSMRLLLCGKPYCSADVEISGAKSFDGALALIPKYLDFLVTDFERYYLCEGSADLDQSLHLIMEDMREANYSEEDRLRFAYAWFKEMEAQGKMSLALIAVYLSGRFQYTWYPSKNSTDISLIDLKNPEKALSIIPAYIEYAVKYYDPCWDDGVTINPVRLLENYLIPIILNAEYSQGEIEKFRSEFLEEAIKRSDFKIEYEPEANVCASMDFADSPF